MDFSIIDDDIDLENDELHIGFNIIGLNDIKYEPISGADYTFHEVINDVKQKAFNYHNFNFIYEKVNSSEIFLRLVIIS